MAKKIVAITSCPTGIAHTYMAAEALEEAAKKDNIEIKVETQGASGAENILTKEDIREADVVIFAVDKNIDTSRFVGKQAITVPANKAIKEPSELMKKALSYEGTEIVKGKSIDNNEKSIDSATGIYKHIMTGVSYMLPLVVAGGILIALSFAFGIYAFEEEGTIPWALYQIGAGSAFSLMVAVMSGFIAHSIGDKSAFAPGIIGGFIANSIGAGFLGGILAGLIAGYLVVFLNKNIKLPKSLKGLKSIMIIPVLSTLIVGLLMYYVIGKPIHIATIHITEFLSRLSGSGAIILGLIFGLFYFDLGGPMSKIVYTFGVGALAEGVYGPMGAAMVCGMVPPIGIALSTFVRPNLWNKDQKEAGKAALFLGLSFITEGAIPFAATNPKIVLPSCMAGSAVGSIVALLLNVEIKAPHGGFFLMFIPNAIGNLLGFIIALIAGSLTTAVLVTILKQIQIKNEETAN